MVYQTMFYNKKLHQLVIAYSANEALGVVQLDTSLISGWDSIKPFFEEDLSSTSSIHSSQHIHASPHVCLCATYTNNTNNLL